MSTKKSSLPPIKGPSHLGEGLEIEGHIHCNGTVYINGSIHGTIIGDGEILIGQTGLIHGTIEGKTIIVGGMVEGSLVVDQQLEVLHAGKIRGNVLLPPGSIVVHEGAVMEGKCHLVPPKV